ncbi:MAG: hypothetical protein E7474_03290 [Ruminococcaceae bacterium]|nr:hypothetical protein [Oscillospiraceae bacterium]
MTGLQWLITVIVLTVAGALGVPLLGSWLRNRDFEAQVSGKKPTRRCDETTEAALRGDSERKRSLEAEGMKWIMTLKSRQNFFGPK